MKILLVNKYNFLKGGADKYFLDLAHELKSAGHEVSKFCMAHQNDQPDQFDRYWASNVEFNGSSLSIWQALRAGFRILWSWEASRKIKALIREFRPDVVHIHNVYHQLSPSVVRQAKRMGLPVVMHLHDYKMFCPNYRMYNSTGVCERCRGGRYYNCARYKCVKNSRAKSIWAMMEMYLHHSVLKVYEKNVDIFIAPSQFMKKKAMEWGVDGKKIIVQPYFIATGTFIPEFKAGEYLLFYGRLEKEKGVHTLIDAVKTVPDITLKIVGTGSEYENIKQRLKSENLDGRIELTGPKYAHDLRECIRNSWAVVVPSEWYEVSGIVNLEAEVLGKPVIAAQIGGISEVIKNSDTGLLFKSGSASDLAAKIRELQADPKRRLAMGEAGRKFALKWFDEKLHLENIVNIYKKAIKEG